MSIGIFMKYFLLKPDNVPKRWLRACLNLTQFYFESFIQYLSAIGCSLSLITIITVSKSSASFH